MSAVSNLHGTGPADAAHRTDAPVWAFHLALAWTAWAIFHVKDVLDVWEHRVITRYPLTTAFGALAATLFIAGTIVALVVNA